MTYNDKVNWIGLIKSTRVVLPYLRQTQMFARCLLHLPVSCGGPLDLHVQFWYAPDGGGQGGRLLGCCQSKMGSLVSSLTSVTRYLSRASCSVPASLCLCLCLCLCVCVCVCACACFVVGVGIGVGASPLLMSVLTCLFRFVCWLCASVKCFLIALSTP